MLHNVIPEIVAYLDPGTGSIAVQVIVAAILSVGIFFRQAIFSPFAFLGFGATPKAEANDDPHVEQNEEPAETAAK